MTKDMEDVINKFNKNNVSNNYGTKDFLKYIAQKNDDDHKDMIKVLDGKVDKVTFYSVIGGLITIAIAILTFVK